MIEQCHVLILDDEKNYLLVLQAMLEDAGYKTTALNDPETALPFLEESEVDVIITDMKMPRLTGQDILEHVKKDYPHIPVLIMTAFGSIEGAVEAMRCGAFDYITKPFHKAELNARIRSILRRNKFSGSNLLQFGEVKVDLLSMDVTVNETPIDLTRKEYDLLVYFMYNAKKVITKESIAEHLWGDHIDQADNFDFLYNHIKNLRKKIIGAGGKGYIQSVYGMGYKFSD